MTLKAFENALRRAAKTARESPEELPLQLGGQHKDWQLVKLGPESGGHGKGHWLRRRQPHTTARSLLPIEPLQTSRASTQHRSA